MRRSVRASLSGCLFLDPERIFQMQFVDKALARRLEACEEMPQVFYSREFQKTRPAVGAAEEEICGGHMIFAGLGSPIGRATGTGLDRPFSAEDLDRVEQFYREHQTPSQVDLCPLHEAAVFEMFKKRGYSIAELNNVLYRRLDRDEQFPAPPAGCEIRRGVRQEAEASSAIVERAFFPDGAPEAFTGLLTPLYQMEGAVTLCGQCSWQNGGLRRRARHSGTPDIRSLRCWNARRVSRTWLADGAIARPPGGGGRGRMRVCRCGHAGRDDFAAQLRTARVSRGLQQGYRD
jgi:hypothetical protein